MGLKVKAGGVWNDASKVHIKLNGAWQTAKQLWGYAAGGWRSAWQNEIRYINTADRTSASIYALMGSPTEPGDYVFENQATISAGSGSYALRTGVFPAGSTLKIINKGYIRGRGGTGGPYNGAGGAGGTALYIDYPCELDNGAGYIYAGGGGGGGSRSYSSSFYKGAAGGGGAGTPGGALGGSSVTTDTSLTTLTQPTVGGASAGGDGGVAKVIVGTFNDYNYGGAGGGLGASGAAGTYAYVSFTYSRQNYPGGAAGTAIAKNGKDVTITAGNNTTRIKGAVA